FKAKGEGAITPNQKKFRQLEHQLDTQFPDWRANETALSLSSDKFNSLISEYNQLGFKIRDDPNTPNSVASWQSIAPKTESQMPGYVEGAVTIPADLSRTSSENYDILFDEQGPVASGQRGYDELKKQQNILFPASHSFPPNTLGFFRGYMEERPDGGKTFHVIEVQSDWAQARQKVKARIQEAMAGEPLATEEALTHVLRNANEYTQGHPLLKDWERLTLKAAIDHARKEGADRIAVSDAETAMMTEGHDRGHIGHDVEDNAGGLVRTGNEISPIRQESGMRLHYDKILPKLLGELTGEEGKKVEFGEHRMAMQGVSKVPRKDLIFRNSDSTPKTSISAAEFPLAKVSAARETAPFTKFGKDRPTQLDSGIPIDSELGTKIKDFFQDAVRGQYTQERAATLLDAADNRARNKAD